MAKRTQVPSGFQSEVKSPSSRLLVADSEQMLLGPRLGCDGPVWREINQGPTVTRQAVSINGVYARDRTPDRTPMRLKPIFPPLTPLACSLVRFFTDSLLRFKTLIFFFFPTFSFFDLDTMADLLFCMRLRLRSTAVDLWNRGRRRSEVAVKLKLM